MPHLRAGYANDHAVIRLDNNPGGNLGRAVRGANDVGTKWKIDPKREPAAKSSRTDDEGTPTDLWYVVHGRLPHALAAAWIAARTCWKVPQRQMLVMALSMSASLGFGLSLSKAATAMIIPLWQ